jgi:hypothetical protein
VLPDVLTAVERIYPRKGESLDPSSYQADGYADGQASRRRGARSSAFEEHSALGFSCTLLRTVADLGPRAVTVAPRVAELVESGRPSIRPDALRTLCAVEPVGAATLRLVSAALKDRSPLLRTAAVDGVRMLGAAAAAMRETLVGMLPTTTTYELRSLAATLDALGEPTPSREEIVACSAFIRKGGDDARTAEAVRRIGFAPADPGVIEVLSPLIDAPQPWISWLAIEALGRQGALAQCVVPRLVALVSKVDFESRTDELWPRARAAAAFEALGRIGIVDGEDLSRVKAAAAKAGKMSSGRLTAPVTGFGYELIYRVAMRLDLAKAAPLVVHVAADARTAPAWIADWHRTDPSRCRVDWVAHDASTIVVGLSEGGNSGRWTGSKWEFQRDYVLLRIRRKAESKLDVAVIGKFDLDIELGLHERGEFSPLEAYRGEARFKSTDLDACEMIAIEYRTEMTSGEGTSPRWRGGFEIPNPWRRPK